mgnify:CR=1 FL=1
MFKKYIGDRKFYKMVLTLGLPIMIQNGISNFVNLLDNIMVGSVGTEQMSGVAVANQFMFVFNLCVFGAISGAGIFSSQFYGKKDHEGIRYCFRFKFLSVLLLSAVAVLIFSFFQEPLISQYLKGNAGQGDPTMVLQCGKDYITIMLCGLLPFGLTQMYSGTLREQNQTLVPMVAGLTAVAVNLGFNWLLIFGHWGFPELGIRGAAIATVISRFVELAIVVMYTHLNREKYPFIVGAYSSMHIPGKLFKDMVIKGTPLLVNEGLWSAGVAVLSQKYSLCGLIVVGAQNISNTVSTFFNMIYMSFGTAISIVVGPLLGRGESEKAVDTARKMITFCVMVSIGVGATVALCAPLFPKLYNVSPDVRDLARRLLIVTGCCSPINGFVHASYFTIRSGGKTLITFLFDSAFMWCVVIPTATILVNFTSITIIPLFLTVSLMEGIKCIVAFILIRKRVWIRKLVD